MKAIVVALVLLGFISGCARQQSAQPSASSPDYRPDIQHASPSECAKAGRQWNGTSGTCM